MKTYNRETSIEQHNKDRMRRSFSWLDKSKSNKVTLYEKFIFQWIAFNAAYGAEVIGTERADTPVSEVNRFKKF